jgi:hypothetical protein
MGNYSDLPSDFKVYSNKLLIKLYPNTAKGAKGMTQW